MIIVRTDFKHCEDVQHEHDDDDFLLHPGHGRP